MILNSGILGLLGPIGVGKSTLLEIIITILEPSYFLHDHLFIS
ncbi:MAG: hypothetical protein ACXAD7_11210 [Candidatus Kariarchaeaceae archaeon]